MNKRTKYIMGALAATSVVAGAVAVKRKSESKKDMGVNEMKKVLDNGDETSLQLTRNVCVKGKSECIRPNILYVENERTSDLMKAWKNNKSMNTVFVTDDKSVIPNEAYDSIKYLNDLDLENETLVYQVLDQYVNSLFDDSVKNALVINVSDEKAAGDLLNKVYNTIFDFSDINGCFVEFTEVLIDKQGVYPYVEDFLSLVDLGSKYNVGTILKIEGESYEEFELLKPYFDLLVCNGNRSALQNLVIEFSIPDKYEHLLYENAKGRSYILYKKHSADSGYNYACLDKSL